MVSEQGVRKLQAEEIAYRVTETEEPGRARGESRSGRTTPAAVSVGMTLVQKSPLHPEGASEKKDRREESTQPQHEKRTPQSGYCT